MIISTHRTILHEQLPPLPFSLKAVGYYYAKKNWEEYNDGKKRNHCGIFWCKSGSGVIRINQTEYQLNAGYFLYYCPYDAHFITVNDDHFEYYWMTFDGPLALSTLQSLQIPEGCNFGGPPPENIYRDSSETLADGTMEALYRGSSLVYRLLCSLKIGKKTSGYPDAPLLVTQFKKVVEEEMGDKNLNLNKIAAKLKCHQTTLTRLIRKHIGFLPGQYLQHVRLNYAMELLQKSTYTAAEISELCGFSTPEFFSRCFCKMTGEPPKRFRDRHIIHPEK